MPRRKRNEQKPKRALTAYLLFSQEKRDSIKVANPSAPFGEIGKLLGQAWKDLPDSEKQKYNEKAAQGKIKYQKDMAKYKEEHPESSDEDRRPRKKQKKKKKKKDPNAPKKPLSAFFLFSKAVRPTIKTNNPEASFGQIGKLIGEEWAKKTPEEKKKYEDMAAEEKKRYERESQAYEAKKKKASSSESDSESEESESESESSDSESESESD
ncbi:FACT complex subunit SSRP1 [Balamuthia mandrillaris]